MLRKFLSLSLALVMMLSFVASAFAINPPEGFHNYTREEKNTWFNENVPPNDISPDITNEESIQPFVYGWIETGIQQGDGYYNDAGLLLTRLTTESRWRIDGNGNVTQYEPVSFSVYRSSYVWPQTGNTDSYGYMPDETVARMTYEISFTDTVYGDVHYHALIHYLYGEGHFNVSEIKGPVGGAT